MKLKNKQSLTAANYLPSAKFNFLENFFPVGYKFVISEVLQVEVEGD